LGEAEPKALYHVAAHQVFKGGATTFLDEHEMQEKLAVRSWNNLQLMVWKGKKIVTIKAPFPPGFSVENKLKVDFVVISNNALKSLEQVEQNFAFGILIIDSSNTFYQANRLAEEAKELKIPYHCVPLQGAFEYTID
jgi:hypothetical protein